MQAVKPVTAQILKQHAGEIISAARQTVPVATPEFWNELGEHFDKQREGEPVVEARQTAGSK